MAASVPEGWVFTATIPSYTQTTLQGDEAIVVSAHLVRVHSTAASKVHQSLSSLRC